MIWHLQILQSKSQRDPDYDQQIYGLTQALWDKERREQDNKSDETFVPSFQTVILTDFTVSQKNTKRRSALF